MGLDLNSIKNKVERLVCSVHGKHPSIKVFGSELKFECCCENFRTKCLDESQKAFAEEAKKTITNTLNNAFKKLR